MTARLTAEAMREATLSIGSKLNFVSSNLISGLLETVAAEPYNGRADMPVIARSLHLEVDDLFPVAEFAHVLGFAELQAGDIVLTPAGREFVALDIQQRKGLFAQRLLKNVPLAARILAVLQERPGHRAPRARFQQELEDFLSDVAAEETIDAIIGWGRYAEIFNYDDKREIFSLDEIEA
jgi:NitT/TauT family transport system ATP-binding protein